MTNYTKNQPLREDGEFAIEIHARFLDTKYRVVIDNYNAAVYSYKQVDVAVVYADNQQPSHCVWFVPGTWENN